MNILTLIQAKSYLWAAIFLCLFCGAWLIHFKLSFKIVGEKMPPAIYLAILFIVSYVSFARPFLQHLTFLVLLGALMATLLCIFGRLNIYKSIYAAVLSIFISFLGDVFLLFVTLGIFPKLFPFMFGSKWGLLILVGMEALFPIMALSVTNPKFSLRLPLRKKSDPFDLFDMGVSWTLISMFYVMDYAMSTAFEAFQSIPQKIGSSLGLLFMTTFGIMGGIMIIIKCMKIMHDREIKTLQDEKEKVESDRNILMDRLKKAYKFKNLDSDEQLSRIVGDFVLDLVSSIRSSGKKQLITPNEINLRKLGINSRNGEILGWMILDKTYQEIADLVQLTEPAVRSRASEMIRTFGLKNRKELAQFAVENNLVGISDE
jgi:DNA-binding CsgD family transcriptional regulator